MKEFLRSPWALSIVGAVCIGIVELVAIQFLLVDPVVATVLGGTFWLFIGLAGFYKEILDRIVVLEASSSAGLNDLWRDAKLRDRLDTALSVFSRIQHPLLRELAVRDFIEAMKQLQFKEKLSSPITHEYFGVAVENYVRDRTHRVRALSRSTVTNWQKFKAASERYRKAQQGKNVTRIFVLKSRAEYDEFQNILTVHGEAFGAQHLFICSEAALAALVESLPPSDRISADEDFAIFDDDVVAICKSDIVRVGTEELDRCRSVFKSVLDHVQQNNQSLEALKKDPSRVGEIFASPL